MARQKGPRNKLARRLGTDLGLKTNPKQLERRINTLPGQHGRRGRGKVSDYGTQLAEKQKAKAIYGVLERQFKNYYLVAAKTPEATGAKLISLLERRLDNAVYRLGFAPTRRAARQLVSHGNILVNGQKLSIPSYQVKDNETISLSTTAAKIPYVKELVENKEYSPPAWLTRKAIVGKVARLPERDDISENINEQLIVEFYSR
jgi:small subunit ribosomal protein S4